VAQGCVLEPHRHRDDGELPLDRLHALILLAAMQAVPREYYEAATVDGANAFRQFWSITLPSLRPTLIFVIITSTIGGLQIFDEPRMYDQTGTAEPTAVADDHAVPVQDRLGRVQLRPCGRARVDLFLIILLIGLINLAITRRLVRDEGGRGVVRQPRQKGAVQ
jgi:cellobiose transport system permease protein